MQVIPQLAEAILEHVHDGVYCVDLGRRIERWNRAAELITGFTAEEVVGLCCADGILNHIDCDGALLCKKSCPIAATICDGRFREASLFLHHKDGHRVPVRVRALPVRDDQGNITGAVEIFSDVTAHEAVASQMEELRTQALIDELTGLPNRRYMRAELNRRLEEFERYGTSFCIFMGDIDQFKRMNDAHGHLAGDQVLKMVAASLQSCCRSFDIVGRWGGEEFLAITRNVDANAARHLGERFRMLVENSFVEYEGSTLTTTISLGGSIVRKGDTPDSLLKRADSQMYTSKETGRNRVFIDEAPEPGV